jgi:MFS family permease
LFLIATVLSGLNFGVLRLLFNFFLLSLGFDEADAGRLLSLTSLTALVGAFPAGFFSDRFGRKNSLFLATLLIAGATVGYVLWPNLSGFTSMSILLGLGQSLLGVTTGPFLMENSGDEERTYLFSFNAGLQTMSSFAGNWFGGQIPAWAGSLLNVAATSSQAYGAAILTIAISSGLALIPLARLKRQPSARQQGEPFLSPFQYARQNPRLLAMLISPMLITSLGAGLLMPFMNIFYRLVHIKTDAAIGALFAWGSLAMGVGLLLAPPLAERYGKIRVVVISQALSIPFLALMGFAPWFSISAGAYLVRLALMNMSNPVYQTFVMERVEREARATVASLVSMSWNFGWATSPGISGWLQINYGFNPVFGGTILCYIVAIFLYWRFFGRPKQHDPETLAPAQGTSIP